MVKIKNYDEFKKIQESDYGYIITMKKNLPPTIHQPKCKYLKKKNFEFNIKDTQDAHFHWFSSISLAEKEIEGSVTCKNCIS